MSTNSELKTNIKSDINQDGFGTATYTIVTDSPMRICPKCKESKPENDFYKFNYKICV